ncbi:MAG: DUF4381 domain-containing protein [Pseudomonadota bacterium]
MTNVDDPASLPLRDIHLPDTVNWWPLAPGWWILLVLLTILFGFIYWWLYKRQKPTRAVIDIANEDFKQIKVAFTQHNNKSILAKDISEFIRRVCLSLFTRTDTASLTGDDWLAFLDQQMEQAEFSQGFGRILNEAPYQSAPDYDDKKLINLIESWLQRVQQQGQKP